LSLGSGPVLRARQVPNGADRCGIAERLRTGAASLSVAAASLSGAAASPSGVAASLSGAAADARISVAVSIGVAVLGQHGNDLFELLAAADAALYRAKDAGRDQVRVYARATGNATTTEQVDEATDACP
jgi:GGDEF domain-containing protein